MILLRCTQVDEELVQFVRLLERSSSDDVLIAVDETRGPVDSIGLSKLSVTADAVRKLGIYTPSDFGWRCGDYILYLANAELALTDKIWLIEGDVRIACPTRFFEAARAAPEMDFLAADLRRADDDWFWRSYALSADTTPYRCFFPVTRYSRAAVHLLERMRHNQSRSLLRRAVWPNDEAFVATTIMSSGLAAGDLNAVIEGAWTPESFQFETPISGESFHLPKRPHLWHPVLYGSAFEAKLRRSRRDDGNMMGRRILRRVVKPILRRSRWDPDGRPA